MRCGVVHSRDGTRLPLDRLLGLRETVCSRDRLEGSAERLNLPLDGFPGLYKAVCSDRSNSLSCSSNLSCLIRKTARLFSSLVDLAGIKIDDKYRHQGDPRQS